MIVVHFCILLPFSVRIPCVQVVLLRGSKNAENVPTVVRRLKDSYFLSESYKITQTRE